MQEMRQSSVTSSLVLELVISKLEIESKVSPLGSASQRRLRVLAMVAAH